MFVLIFFHFLFFCCCIVGCVCPWYTSCSPCLTCCPAVVYGGRVSQPNFRLLNTCRWYDQWPMQSQGCALWDLCIRPKGLKSTKETSILSLETPFSIGSQISRQATLKINYLVKKNLINCKCDWVSCLTGLRSVITCVLNTLSMPSMMCMATNSTEDFSGSHTTLLEILPFGCINHIE